MYQEIPHPTCPAENEIKRVSYVVMTKKYDVSFPYFRKFIIIFYLFIFSL